MRRYALRDDQWDRIKDFLPGREGQWAARRRTIGCSWRRCSIATAPVSPGVTCHQRFSDWKIVHQRHGRWAKSGVFAGIFKMLASDHDNEYMMIDATIVRAHRHSAGRGKTASKPSADPAAD